MICFWFEYFRSDFSFLFMFWFEKLFVCLVCLAWVVEKTGNFTFSWFLVPLVVAISVRVSNTIAKAQIDLK